MQHELATDQQTHLEQERPSGLMSLTHSRRGFGVGILPDEADRQGICHYSSERVTVLLASWAEHGLDMANRILALTAENEELRHRVNALEMLVSARKVA